MAKQKEVVAVGLEGETPAPAAKPGQPVVAAAPPPGKAAVVKQHERAPAGLKRFRCRGKPDRSSNGISPPVAYIVASDKAQAVEAYLEHVGPETVPDAAAVVVVAMPD